MKLKQKLERLIEKVINRLFKRAPAPAPEVPDRESELSDSDILSVLRKFNVADEEGQQAIVRFLISVLEEDDPELRESASRALVSISEPAVPELIRALKENELLRRDIAIILAGIGEPAVEALIELLNSSEDEMTKWAAIWALGEIGDGRAYEPLMELLAREGSLFFLRTVQEAVEKIMEKNEIEYK